MRFAINPLQWAATGDGQLDVGMLPGDAELMRILANVGFRAVHTTVATQAALPLYRMTLANAGLEPAPGYFSLPSADLDGIKLDAELARAHDMARAHAELGLSEIFLADDLNHARTARPARGVDFSSERLARIVIVMRRVAEAFLREGIMCCLHQHVGSWIETEEEFLYVLDQIDSGVLGAGPDVGHLTWAGADPVGVISALGERVRVAHLKDLHLEVIPVNGDLSYQEVVSNGIWTEPGRGDVDLEACLAAMQQSSTKWAVVEVDQADNVAPAESARRCAAWVDLHQ